MPTTLTNAQVAVGIRAATAIDDIPEPVETLLGFLIPAGKAIVEEYTPDAPDAVLDLALIRVVGWMYDADPAEAVTSNPLLMSGAGAILARWRIHRAGAVSGEDAIEPGPTPGPGGNVPTPPGDGNYILTSDNGSLEWVLFPKP